jgi:predicted O-methyltransferase YrrM
MELTHKMREGGQKQGLLELCHAIKSHLGDNNLQIVEIGSYCGDSGAIFASMFPGSTLNCVDPWEQYTEDDYTWDLNKQALELQAAEKLFESVMERFLNMKKNKMSSFQYSSVIEDDSVDFVYIDGNHQYSSVKEDLVNWSKKVKNGGIIAGHDYAFEPITRALNEYFNESPVATFMDGSWFYFNKK